MLDEEDSITITQAILAMRGVNQRKHKELHEEAPFAPCYYSCAPQHQRPFRPRTYLFTAATAVKLFEWTTQHQERNILVHTPRR